MSGRRTLLRQAGVGLVEVMIALLLSLLTVGVIIQVLLGNHKTYLTGEAIARPASRTARSVSSRSW